MSDSSNTGAQQKNFVCPMYEDNKKKYPDPKSPIRVVDEFNQLMMQFRAVEAIDRYVAEDFIDHDPKIPGGNKAGLYKAMEMWGHTEVNPDKKIIDIVDREFQIDEYAFVHHHLFRYPGDRGLVFVDSYRVIDGLIVEHWDVMQEVPEPGDNPHPIW